MKQLNLGIMKKSIPIDPYKMTEHMLMTWCVSYLTVKGCFVMRVNVTGSQKRQHSYQRKDGTVNNYTSWIAGLPKGVPDVIGYSPTGKFIGIEVKVKPNKPSFEQTLFIDNLNKAGGIGAIIYSQEELMAIKGL